MEQTHSARRGVRWSLVTAIVATAACTFPFAASAQSADSAGYGALYRLGPTRGWARDPATPVQLLGNLYLFDPSQSTLSPFAANLLGGFRLSTGIVGAGQSGSVFRAARDGAPNLPYFGLGYSRLWFHNQLSLNADVGIATPGGSVLGRARGGFGGMPALDDGGGDPRWAPVAAVNLRYAF